MIKESIRGRSILPRIGFEVHPSIKRAIVEKCRIEGVSMRTVGNYLFKQWLAIPAVPDKRICQKRA